VRMGAAKVNSLQARDVKGTLAFSIFHSRFASCFVLITSQGINLPRRRTSQRGRAKRRARAKVLSHKELPNLTRVNFQSHPNRCSRIQCSASRLSAT
jgi:hypothetical protein